MPAGDDFDALARTLGVPTIAYVDVFTVRPLVEPDGSGCVALLVEASVPLEATHRLTVQVNGDDALVRPNADETRLVVLPHAGVWAGAVLTVTLTWSRAGDGNVPVRSVDGDTSPEIVVFDIDTGVPS
jgi:hypothetical protein